MDVEKFKKPLRAVRAWAPLNVAVTGAARAALRRLGWQPGPLARYLPRMGLVETPLPDARTLRMWTAADDEITSAVFWKGWSGHEPETAPLFYQFARSASATLDIGAHVGYFALLAAHANPAGTVYAFEPHPRVYQRLSRNVALNHLQNVFCVPLAVGGQAGTAKLFHVKHGIPSSSSLSKEFMASIGEARQLDSSDVAVVTIDDFVRKRGITGVDLAKIDTEATEDTVIQGMAATIARDRPTLFCEILSRDTAQSIEEFLSKLGYEFFVLTDRGPVECRHIFPHPPWRNYCFVSKERSSRGGDLSFLPPARS